MELQHIIGWVVALAGGAFLYMTKPAPADFESLVKPVIFHDIQTTSYTDDPAFNAFAAACRVSPETCYPAVRASIKISSRDFLFGRHLILSSPSYKRNCIAIVHRIFCF